MAVRLIHSFTESPTNPQRSYNDQTLNRLETFTQTKEKNNKYNNEYCRLRVQTQHPRALFTLRLHLVGLSRV